MQTGHDSRIRGLREKGWSTGDVSDPEYEKIYFTIADRMIRHTRCRYFTAESNEWRHNRKNREKAEDTVRGFAPQEYMAPQSKQLFRF